jgi:hypothetical protein
MALRFTATANGLTITQRRGGLRVAMWLFVIFGGLGAVMAWREPARTVSITCSRERGTCDMKQGYKTHKLPLAAITTSAIKDDALVIDRSDSQGRYFVCFGARDVLEPPANALSHFLGDPSARELKTTCESKYPTGIPLAGKIAGLLGSVLLLLLMGVFLEETHVVIDRPAGTITMRGNRWPLRRWSLERRIEDVENVAVRQVYVGRGQRMRLVDVNFKDGTRARAFSPAAYRLETFEHQVAELRRSVGHDAEHSAQ